MLAVSLHDSARELSAVEAFIADRTDAVILVGSRLSGKEAEANRRRVMANLKRYAANGGRAAAISQRMAGAQVLVPDNAEGTVALAPPHFRAGPPAIRRAERPRTVVTAANRTAGFLSSLARAGVDPVDVIESASDRDGGYDGAQQLVRQGPAGGGPCASSPPTT